MKKKKLALSLSGGGIGAMAYIGLLKVFEEENIEINEIGGLSGGALVAGLYSAGFSTLELEELASEHIFREIININPFRRFEILSQDKIFNKLTEILERKKVSTFADCKIPLRIFVTNTQTLEDESLTEGVLADSILASLAMPPLISPKVINGNYYIDGGFSLVYGAKYFRKNNDVVIGSALYRAKMDSLPGTQTMKDLMSGLFISYKTMEKLEKLLYPVDVDILIKKENAELLDHSNVSEKIKFGYDVTKSHMFKINKLLGRN